MVALLSQGLKNKEIAAALRISEATVKVYLSKLFQKLGVKDRFELALFGLRNMAPGASSLGDGSAGSPKTPMAPMWQPPRSFFLERAAVRLDVGQRLPAGRLRP